MDLQRYSPQMRLAKVGKVGQSRLMASSVLIVGCGALGSPIAMYLAGAGVGNIMLVDFDTIDISNLHRQVFYSESELGMDKAKSLKNNIIKLNSQVKVEVLNAFLTPGKLADIEAKFDAVIDAADNPDTTYMLDEYCANNKIPLITAGVSGFNAQVFVYVPGSTRYSEVFLPPADSRDTLPCSIEGILGPVAGFASSIQAVETLKIILKTNEQKGSMLFNADFLSNKMNVISV